MPSKKDSSKGAAKKTSRAKKEGAAASKNRDAQMVGGGSSSSGTTAGTASGVLPGVIALERERANFKQLITANPNHFGSFPTLSPPASSPIKFNTKYEEMSCLGYDPRLKMLQATVKIKLPNGYSGNLCTGGSTEYVRFYIDYGGGWQDVGYVGFNVHDIPNTTDCARLADKPLTYVATLNITPETDICRRPVMPAVRAILSWEYIPPANMPDWTPPWGNVRERHIQVRPRRRRWPDIFAEIAPSILQQLELPPLEVIAIEPIPLPDPPPLKLAQLAQLYGAQSGKRATGATGVEPHRFGFAQVQSIVESAGNFSSAGGAGAAASATRGLAGLANASFGPIKEFAQFGIDWQNLVNTIYNTNNGNVTYEQLDCLGLDYNREWLVASFTLKKESGYSGSLCTAGSKEHVAFWADWNDTCEWTYLGTVSIDVHDIATMPDDGLRYTVNFPVDFTYLRRKCSQPKIARVRAVLSWSSPPSQTNPDQLPFWGNRVDSHVQIKPGETIDPGEPKPEIRAIGGIPVEDIVQSGPVRGMTSPTAKFFFGGAQADYWGQARECPFGAKVIVHGRWFHGYKYQVRVRREGTGEAGYTPVPYGFYVTKWLPGETLQAPNSGWFTFLNPADYFENTTLAEWYTVGDERWEVQLRVATMDESRMWDSQPYVIQLDNTAPEADIQIDVAIGGDCNDFGQGTSVSGQFVARDANFGAFGLSTLPNTAVIPSNQPTTTQPLYTQTPPRVPPVGYPWTGGATWTVDTGAPMRPCGYVVHLSVHDRTIINSQSGPGRSSSSSTAFCLRKK
ncbi:MAG TPA: hypothetical protein VNA19_13690 [Pyrinomonadaceae bacterium]|jgi:hypothetical protein|nr:hypothetical protein [Pyrinomonadaceae bacterium]